MKNNFTDIKNIKNIKSLESFIQYNEEIATYLADSKDVFKAGFSSMDKMSMEIKEYTDYSSYVYKKLVEQVLKSKYVTEEQKQDLKKNINYDYKAFNFEDKEHRHYHMAVDNIGYTKVYDARNFCTYLKPLLENVIPNLDNEISKITGEFVSIIEQKKDRAHTKDEQLAGHLNRHKYDAPKQKLRSKKFKSDVADKRVDVVNSRYDVGNTGIHYDAFGIEGNGFTSTLQQANERLAATEGKPASLALYDKILVLNALEAKHNERGFFNKLFNYKKFDTEERYIEDLKNTIVNDETYKMLQLDSIEDVRDTLYEQLITPMIQKQIDDRTKEIVSERNKEVYDQRIDKLQKDAVGNGIHVAPQNMQNCPKTMFVIDEAAEEEEYEKFDIQNEENVEQLEDEKDLEA